MPEGSMTGNRSAEQVTAEEEQAWSLGKMLAPLTVEEFARDYWERRTLVIQRGKPDFFTDLMTLDDMDRILSQSRLHESHVHVVTGGGRHAFRDEHPHLEAVYAQYRSGATINVIGVHQNWEPLAALCRSLSQALSAAVQVNAYLTPAKAQGFSTHYDTHDVLVLQVYGSKAWRLYDPPARLPETGGPWTPPDRSPAATLNLGQGDLLYLPRGTPHDAASNESASVHLTIGVQPVTWASVLRSAVNTVIASDSRYREALPMGFAMHGNRAAASHDQLARLVVELADRICPAEVIDAAARSIRATVIPSLRGHLPDIESLGAIDLETRVARRPGLAWLVKRDDTNISIEFNGKVIRLPARLAADVLFAAEATSFTGRDLPGSLDAPGRIKLVSTLLREGFVTTHRCGA
jgi:ribosomal protein L16 Arg81 hydroxylase